MQWRPRAFLRTFLFLTILLPLAGGIAVGGFLFLGETQPTETIIWGVNFSHKQAQDLGLSWQDTFTALLDDLNIRRVRIALYWDELEPERGNFHFENWDWQLNELSKRNGTAIVTIGRKLPRWPECRVPQWAAALPEHDQQEATLRMLKVAVEHYREHPAVAAWQVENEPLLKFGLCPKRDRAFLDREIALVRELDPSRLIIISDTGEFSAWLEAGKRADIIGSTLYRVIHDPTVGYIRYPFPPVMYHRKAQWIQYWHPDIKVIFTEVQAEPWVTSLPITRFPLNIQFETMSPEQFRSNIEYVRRTGFDEAYLWGAEWWYWLKLQGESDIWYTAATLFSESIDK